MKGKGIQILSITLRTDAHAATNRASRPGVRPITPQFTLPCLTLINIHITTLYVSVCRMRSDEGCAYFHYKNKAIMKKTVFFAADGFRLPASKRIRSNQPFSRRTQS